MAKSFKDGMGQLAFLLLAAGEAVQTQPSWDIHRTGMSSLRLKGKGFPPVPTPLLKRLPTWLLFPPLQAQRVA